MPFVAAHFTWLVSVPPATAHLHTHYLRSLCWILHTIPSIRHMQPFTPPVQTAHTSIHYHCRTRKAVQNDPPSYQPTLNKDLLDESEAHLVSESAPQSQGSKKTSPSDRNPPIKEYVIHILYRRPRSLLSSKRPKSLLQVTAIIALAAQCLFLVISQAMLDLLCSMQPKTYRLWRGFPYTADDE